MLSICCYLISNIWACSELGVDYLLINCILYNQHYSTNMSLKRIILETIFQMTLKSQFWEMFRCLQHLRADILRISNNFRPRLIRNGEMWWVDSFVLHLEANIPHNDSSWREFVVQLSWHNCCHLQVGILDNRHFSCLSMNDDTLILNYSSN